ncbi:hypothetical protein, partial [Bacillus cereus group sp. N17]|uniref:hypothetical protein n=1 Tax=Bacillus cereus group sp. N17 TaxID=2794589 RepID=UPI001A7E29AF
YVCYILIRLFLTVEPRILAKTLVFPYPEIHPRLLFHDSLDQKPKKSTSSNKFCSISTKKLKNRYIPAKHITKPIHPKATIRIIGLHLLVYEPKR